MKTSLAAATVFLLLFVQVNSSLSGKPTPRVGKSSVKALDVLKLLYDIHEKDPFTLNDFTGIFTRVLESNSTSNSTDKCSKDGLLDEFGRFAWNSANFAADALLAMNQFLNGPVACVQETHFIDFVICGFTYLYTDVLSAFTFLKQFLVFFGQALTDTDGIVGFLEPCL